MKARRGAIVSALGMLISLPPAAVEAAMAEEYRSPYDLAYTVPVAELLAGDATPPRNDYREESTTPYSQWYADDCRRTYGSWGPRPRTYPPLPGVDSRSATWKRQRVIALAQSMIGLPYQHHHIPDFSPPADWPWKEVKLGHQSKGLDCSNFTAWLYNYGLGIKIQTNVKDQAEEADIVVPGQDGMIQAQTVSADSYEALVKKLVPGDLLYIKNSEGKVSHVVMWIGEYGKSPDRAPLVIDCTDTSHRDASGNPVPQGVHLRPFLPDGWYYKSFSHAHRILP